MNIERTKWCFRCDRAHPESAFPLVKAGDRLRNYCRESEERAGRRAGHVPPPGVVRDIVRKPRPKQPSAVVTQPAVAPGVPCNACGRVPPRSPCRPVTTRGVTLVMCAACRLTTWYARGDADRLRACADALEQRGAVPVSVPGDHRLFNGEGTVADWIADGGDVWAKFPSAYAAYRRWARGLKRMQLTAGEFGRDWKAARADPLA